MKIKYLFVFAAILACLALAGCKEPAKFFDAIYITGAEDNPIARLTIEGPDEIGLSVSSSRTMDEDVEIKLVVDPAKIDQYNAANFTKYRMIPDGAYQLSSDVVTIEADKHVSNSIKVMVTNLDDFEEGVTYCIPVSIAGANKDIAILEPSATRLVVISMVIETDAVRVQSQYYRVPGFLDSGYSAVSKLSYEIRVNPYSYAGSDPLISTIMGIEEGFVLRFGDSDIKNSQLQVAKGSYKATTTKEWPLNTWYHVAAVFDVDKYYIYVNGQLEASLGDVGHGPLDLTTDYHNGFNIGQSRGSRYLNGAVSEARVWLKALNINEIQANMCYVDPTSPDLLAYWRFDNVDPDTKKVKDLTGHGYDAVTAGSINYVKGIKCPE